MRKWCEMAGTSMGEGGCSGWERQECRGAKTDMMGGVVGVVGVVSGVVGVVSGVVGGLGGSRVER